ncbi:3-hydroxyacyl-CoA dehydrogenase family protein [Paenibacillus silvae]|uniref:3-hydroxyacyl-CoA dehydrogenase family protein n=1 Tax=Paenibacillus silvae TaxID=1325358 RepID=UPI00249DD4CD|nr:3-hydroxyacyl-CoA dehydrogenase family protein [Paenibacillus silvae]MCK6076572.1 3-hydroxyacyl-CoA dehydrogenase family protein [Paenibacillus silvae]MCK6150999.1 3-hydroxyacyl-CoA dehydrogenase family protein [Paenibacillus silvae]MCK6269259.1 3-hydroxyacyl-CoA dehydrogenase family protein [Paenibacillus silvae]
MNKIGVVGAGTMGVGVTADLVLHGYEVTLVDTSFTILENAKNEICEIVRFAPILIPGIRKMSEQETLKRITFTNQYEELANSEFVIENVTEDWKIKSEVYKKLDMVCQSHVCFGVNTSCISITKLGSLTSRPSQLIGMHFMNPVILKPCIEMIRGEHTSDTTTETALKLLEQMGKESIIVNDYAGFVSNRISHLFMNEAAWVVQDQMATPQQVDEIFKKCFGHKMGPLETADLIGLDTVMHSLDVLYDSYHDPKFRCAQLLRKMVDSGYCGKKSGKGFYNYNELTKKGS